jgi:type IV fimbrial biogenesis protein FimT
MPAPSPAADAGITLLDVLVTIAVAAVLAAGAAPAFTGTIATADRTAALNALVGAIQLARNAAITRGADTVLCMAPAADQCGDSGAGAWESGLVVFVNEDRDSPPRRDDGEPILLVRKALPGVRITANREAFTFRRLERRSTNGTLVVCDRRGDAHARALIVSWTGRPRIAAVHADGTALECPR